MIPEDEDHMVELHIVDIEMTYNILLGRPWIHSQNIIASILHLMIQW